MAISADVTSTIERAPITNTDPTSAPTTAAVIPSTNALILVFFDIFLKYGAGRTVKTKQGRKTPNAATAAPAKPETNKAYCDHHRSGRDHSHGNRIQKLLLVELSHFTYHTSLQKRNNRQSASKNECPGLGKKEP
jgi:hypothetical protein